MVGACTCCDRTGVFFRAARNVRMVLGVLYSNTRTIQREGMPQR